jgi:hypothetical protein
LVTHTVPRKSEFPKIIRRGSVSVKIYRVAHPRTSSGYIYFLKWKSEGVWRKRSLAAEADAIQEAEAKATQLDAGESEVA